MGTATLTEPSGTMAGAVVKTNDDNIVSNMLLSLDQTHNLSENYTYGSIESSIRKHTGVGADGISWNDIYNAGPYIMGASGDYAFAYAEILTYKAPFPLVLTSLHAVVSEIGTTLSSVMKFTIQPSVSTSNRNNASWTNYTTGYQIVIDSNGTPEIEVIFGSPISVASGSFIRVICDNNHTGAGHADADLCVKLRWKALHVT